MKNIGLLLLLCFFSVKLFAGNEQIQQQLNQVNKNFFIENRGQWPAEVKYLAKVGGMNAWITNSGVVYDYFKITKNYNESETLKMTPDKKQDFERKNTSKKGHVVKMSLADANTSSLQQGNNIQEGYYNYFTGNDKSKWASNVPLYGDVQQNDIYQNINVKYYFDGNLIRYDYIVKPGADLTRLRLQFEGQESTSVNEAGELVIKTSLGEVTNGKLYSYQLDNGTQKEVSCRFAQNADGTISLNATSFDKNKELIIDPLIYSTFIGGIGDDWGNSIAIDADGNGYITGGTKSSNYPTKLGAYDSTFGGGSYDAFITKLNPTLSALVYSTYIGGNSVDEAYSIAVDAGRNAYITGNTASSNYPTTHGAYDTTFGGSIDVFVTKLNPTGDSLIYSTYIGGIREDYGESISVDESGNAYITGWTYSTNYPITSGAFQKLFNSGMDGINAFITKLNPTGSALIYSTYMGDASGRSIAVDNSGNAYITGGTRSSNYPMTPGAYQDTLKGTINAFVTKLNPTGDSLVYSTYIGGNSADEAYSITVDAGGNAYITGQATSTNYPTTHGAYDTTFGGGYYDAFITKLNPKGDSLIYSTLIGGNGGDKGSSIAVDAGGNAYITGNTYSSNYPTTSEAFQTYLYGNQGTDNDVFITKLNPTGSALIYSTYIGGTSYDVGNSIAVDTSGNAYITGRTYKFYTYSTNYPTTPGAYQTENNGGLSYSDAFITKLSLQSQTPTISITSPLGGEKWQVGNSYYITWARTNAANVKIEYTTDNGTSWSTVIATTPASSGRYYWTIPNTASTQCKVRISDVSDASIYSISTNVFTIIPITITSPNGGENWVIGTSQNITWMNSSNVTNIKIEYTTDNGTNWSQIIASTATGASAGSYAWRVPSIFSTQCRVRLSNVSDASVYSISKNVFTITPVPITSPNGATYWSPAEKWVIGTSQNITWTSGSVTNIKIEYTTNNGTNWSTIIASTAASAGSYAWIVPNTPSALCKVRISDVNDASLSSMSTNVFTITPIVITSPNGGENWVISTLHNITWMNSSNVTNIKIEYTTDNGTNWLPIIASTASSAGSYEWIVPGTASTQCKVRLSDFNDASQNIISTYVFTINPIAINSPNGGECWLIGGNTQNITWTSHNITNIKIEYTTNNGTNWSQITASTAALAGSYVWTVPSTASTQCEVRISDVNVNDPSFNSVSATPFTIYTPNQPCSGHTTVELQGKTYHTVKIGNQCWLSKNLDVGTMINGSLEQTNNGTIEKYCYYGSPDSCTKYGGLYQWAEAVQYQNGATNIFLTNPQLNGNVQGICPTDWHIPTYAEMQILINSLSIDGNSLKAVGQGITIPPYYYGAGTNTSGFSALLEGFYFLSSTENDATDASFMTLDYYDRSINFPQANKESAGSVRCVMNGPGNPPLPVELSSFVSNVNGRDINLNWATSTEKNSDKFNIERKTTGTDWGLIGSVKAAVLSNSPKQYSFTNKDLQSGKYQYRLKMIDNDGTFEYSKVIEIKVDVPKNFELSQNYPNPFNPTTKINYSLPFDSRVTLEVYNITGARVSQLVNEEQSAGYYNVSFGSSKFSSGVYFYRMTAVDKATGNNFSSIKKMILLK